MLLERGESFTGRLRSANMSTSRSEMQRVLLSRHLPHWNKINRREQRQKTKNKKNLKPNQTIIIEKFFFLNFNFIKISNEKK